MQTTTSIPHTLSSAALDELLTPIAALITDPRNCDLETGRVVERLAYLVTRGTARDGRVEFLKSMNVSAMTLFLEEIRHDSANGEPNWFRLAQILEMSPRDARDMFPNWVKQ